MYPQSEGATTELLLRTARNVVRSGRIPAWPVPGDALATFATQGTASHASISFTHWPARKPYEGTPIIMAARVLSRASASGEQ